MKKTEKNVRRIITVRSINPKAIVETVYSCAFEAELIRSGGPQPLKFLTSHYFTINYRSYIG